MAGVNPTEARFPGIRASAGHYESYYLKACHPEEPLGVWIRYTVHKPPDEEPKGSVWFTLFEAGAGGPVAAKETLPEPDHGRARLDQDRRRVRHRARAGRSAGRARPGGS